VEIRHAAPLSMSEVELIRACAESNDSAAWDEFVSRFHLPIGLSIIRTARQWGKAPDQIADDLVQETYLKLCANKCQLLLQFAERHPEAIVGYIKTIAINVAHDYFKTLYSKKRGAGEVSQFLDDLEPKAPMSSPGGQEAIQREILLRQIGGCLEVVSDGPLHERDCLIFWLYYQQGMSAKTIAGLPSIGLSVKGVESTIFRLTRLFRERMVDSNFHPSGESDRLGKGFLPTKSY
jgi:RNA polymerase sigma-70 factor, ECF subfamily